MLELVKNFFGKIILVRKIKLNRNKNKRISFENSLEIGIIYNADDEKNENKIQEFAAELRKEGKKVALLGFINQKELLPKKVPHISSEFFWKEKLSFFNLPIKEKIGNFLDTNFDILFNIYFEEENALLGSTLICKAKYKIGAQMNYATHLFDMTIDTGKNKDVFYLAKQMEFYLKTI